MDEGNWVGFDRGDVSAVVAIVRQVAEAGDAGLHGDGVEVIVEAPKLSWFARITDDDGRPDQARIVVTTGGGAVGYPFEVRLIADGGGRAARKIPLRRGWARSESAGLAFLIQKGGDGIPYAWVDLVEQAVAALSALRGNAPDGGWRACVDRAISRT